jgi:hypothetical protein
VTISEGATPIDTIGIGDSWTWNELGSQAVGWGVAGAAGGFVECAVIGTPVGAACGAAVGGLSGVVAGAGYYAGHQAYHAVFGPDDQGEKSSAQVQLEQAENARQEAELQGNTEAERALEAQQEQEQQGQDEQQQEQYDQQQQEAQDEGEGEAEGGDLRVSVPQTLRKLNVKLLD